MIFSHKSKLWGFGYFCGQESTLKSALLPKFLWEGIACYCCAFHECSSPCFNTKRKLEISFYFNLCAIFFRRRLTKISNGIKNKFLVTF